MNNNGVFFCTLLSLLMSFSTSAQVTERKFNGDENYLRMCISWSDSTEYQIPSYPTSSKYTICKFNVRSLFWGVYREREIYVGTYRQHINKFNSKRQLNHDYFWTLRKTEYTVNGFPFYLHSGNF